MALENQIEGVMKLRSFSWHKRPGGSDYYRFASECDCRECDMGIDIEWDTYSVNLDIFYNVGVEDYYYQPDNRLIAFFYRIKWRIYTAFKVLFTGKIKTEAYFSFRGSEQIRALIDVCQEGIKQHEKRKELLNDQGKGPKSN